MSMIAAAKSFVRQRVSPERWARLQWLHVVLRKRVRRAIGFDETQWARVTTIQAWKAFLQTLPVERLDALEISPARSEEWKNVGFRSYRSVQFPDFDIGKDALPETFDVIIAEHVFEHIRRPYSAARNVRKMLKDDGVFLIVTPFLVKVHAFPHDYTRWTADGLQGFLEDCGFYAEVQAWGNRQAVVSNLTDWTPYGLGRDLRNEADFPVCVWAFARKNLAWKNGGP
jgi:SAM-dependent methyltransferase